ncbi:MAG: response regulator [Anaerolineales bacterium]
MTSTGHRDDTSMTSYQEFEEALKSALPNLYDPASSFPNGLAEGLGTGQDGRRRALRDALIQAIEDLKPDPQVPRHARAWRIYELLRLRYVEQRTQEESAARLAITVRHLAREQKKAVRLLARRLWEERESKEEKPIEEGNWERQVEEEMASIHKHAPQAIVEVNDVLKGIARLTRALFSKRDVALEIDPAPALDPVAIHPSILRQAVVAAVTYALDAMEQGQIRLSSRKEKGRVIVLLEACPVSEGAAPPPPHWLGRELLTSQEASVDCRIEESALTLRMALPPARRAKVLVVDDNEDLYHLYQLYTTGTGFQLSDLTEGGRVFEVIAADRPDIIVLDLILPDVDGWELLAQLHEHPLSRDIPVIVCSVVHERELAYDLGAIACMIKPVAHQEFIRALEEALNRIAEGEGESPANSATTG